MSNSSVSNYNFPVYLVKGVATSGHFVDVSPLSLGIYDRVTSNVSTQLGNGKEFFLAGGSPHTRDQFSKFYAGMQKPEKSPFFYGKDIIHFEKAYPGRPQNEEWTLGYGGGSEDTTLAFEKGKSYQVKIKLYGEPAFSRFNKSLEKVITLPSTCDNTTACSDDCADTTAEIKAQTIKWANLIQNNVELKEFDLKVYPVFSDYAATAYNSFVYDLSVTDNGDIEALQDVQRAYSTTINRNKIVRKSYNNGVSVYEVIGLTTNPSTFTPGIDVLLSVCGGTCPSGYSTVAGFDTYLISRPVTPSTDLDDSGAQATYAASIVTAYSAIASSGQFLGLTSGANSVANVRIDVTSGTTVTGLLSDVATKLASTPARCTPSAASAIAWVQVDSGYTVTRTLKATITADACAPITTAMIEADFAARYPSYVTGSVDDITDDGGALDNCVYRFQITQISGFMQDVCMSPDLAQYADEYISYQGVKFEPTAIDYGDTSTVKSGLRFVAPFYSFKFNDCSFDPEEYYDYKPLQMEVSIWDQSGDVCSLGTQAKARKTKMAKFQRLTGEFVRRDLIRGSVYFKWRDFSNDPRMREVVDNNLLATTKPSAYYVAYYLKFKTSQDKEANQQKELFEPIFYIEESDIATQLAFETAIEKVTAKFGVGLTIRVASGI